MMEIKNNPGLLRGGARPRRGAMPGTNDEMRRPPVDTVITILGNGAVRPSVGGESASILVNGHVLVDVGWCNVLHMRRFGIDPAGIDHLVITHFHHDHYMGLPQLLYFLGRGRRLTILGPAEDL